MCGMLHVGRVHAVCGNKRCEIGEERSVCDSGTCVPNVHACEVDCPFVLKQCPVSVHNHSATQCGAAGLCLLASGECSCFRGYVGAACQVCVCVCQLPVWAGLFGGRR